MPARLKDPSDNYAARRADTLPAPFFDPHTALTPHAMSPAVPLAATRAAPRVESRFLPPAVSHMA